MDASFSLIECFFKPKKLNCSCCHASTAFEYLCMAPTVFHSVFVFTKFISFYLFNSLCNTVQGKDVASLCNFYST